MKKLLALVLVVVLMVLFSSPALASVDSKKVYLGRIGVFSTQSDVESYVNIENNYGSDLKEMHVVAVIPELGLRVSLGPFTIDDEEEATKRLLVDTYGAEPGDYYVRITVSNDDIRRVKHRIITI